MKCSVNKSLWHNRSPKERKEGVSGNRKPSGSHKNVKKNVQIPSMSDRLKRKKKEAMMMLIDIFSHPGIIFSCLALMKPPKNLPHRNECYFRPDVQFRSLSAHFCIRCCGTAAKHSTVLVWRREVLEGENELKNWLKIWLTRIIILKVKLTVIQLRRLLLHIPRDLVHFNEILLNFRQCHNDSVQLLQWNCVRSFVKLCHDGVGCLIQREELKSGKIMR